MHLNCGVGEDSGESLGLQGDPNGRAFELSPGVGGRQGGLAGCSPWGCRVGHD